MPRMMVTLGSDGHVDWIQTPDGQKFTLGPISVFTFVRKLSDRPIRATLDRFLQTRSVMFSVDQDRMWELLKPVRVRLAGGPFMPSSVREERNSMHEVDFQAIEAALNEAEKALGALDKKVAAGQMEGISSSRDDFMKAADKIKSPNQSKNQTYYGLGDQKPYEAGKDAPPKPHLVTDKAPKPDIAPTAKSAGLEKLSYDILQENTTIAGEILANLEETFGCIDTLVKAGKKFNSSKAKADLHEVSSKVAGILRDVDLTQSWVRGDLDKLSTRAGQLRGLFFPVSQQGG